MSASLPFNICFWLGDVYKNTIHWLVECFWQEVNCQFLIKSVIIKIIFNLIGLMFGIYK
jgi:hypothetical protein